MPPIASSRFQLTPDFGFDRVRELFEPLTRLGVSHVYLSPVAAAVPDSEHGYDVTDHRYVRAEFGGEDGLIALLDDAADHCLAVVIDHVPNHVSVAHAELNPHWWTMLRDGPSSDAARWFDVDWDLTDGKVIVPKLGDRLDEVVSAGGIDIVDGELRYGPLRFPMAAGTADLPLREALVSQHYRLAWWREPERNVRRFFTIDDLVAVRVENPDVAELVDTIPRLLANHVAFGGVRVDHVDGLADPGGYLRGLRDLIGDRWLIVEKILAPSERLPESWPVDGTTGYEHITVAEHTMLDPAARTTLVGAWTDLTDDTTDFEDLEHRTRREVLTDGLAPDLRRVARCISDRCDLDSDTAADALIELTLALHRYRTYLPGDEPSTAVLEEARSRAVERRPELAPAIDTVAALVSTDDVVRTRWQQLTGSVMAKGAEDRAFYRYLPLASLCEVGGAPGTWTLDVADFHEQKRGVQSGWPTTMLAGTTHDTKRSGAVRARSLALAERAERWVAFADDWRAAHPHLVGELHPIDVTLALQTAVTAAPIDAERLRAYLVKSAREADLATSWTEPDDDYEHALGAIASELANVGDPAALGGWPDELASAGAAIGLRLLALQLTCPGVPDLYQGAPSERTTLVDPDNRQEPHWQRWKRLVGAAASTDVRAAHSNGEVDLARTVLTSRVLDLRARRPGAFGRDATYDAVACHGDGSDDVVAYTRGEPDGPVVTVVVTRAVADRTWDDLRVEVPEGAWRSVLDDDAPVLEGGPKRLSDLIGQLGVAVLERTDA